MLAPRTDHDREQGSATKAREDHGSEGHDGALVRLDSLQAQS
jgi:hypothetical protein